MKNLTIYTILSVNILFAQNHAIIIGCCSDYKNSSLGIPSLNGTQNDAKSIKDLLISRGSVKEENIDFFTNKEATHDAIVNAFKKLEKSNIGKGDKLYVYYSGHGTSCADSSNFANKIKSNRDILNRLNNSAAFIPYDFDLDNALNTLIITSRDFKPTFKKLDKRGVNIIWIADACFAGNAFRSVSGKKQKFIKSNITYKSNDKTTYNNLIFYGASLSTIPTTEIDYKGQKRGAFSIELEKCFNKPYKNKYITNQELKNCLEQNYPLFAMSAALYPIDNSLDNKPIIKAKNNAHSYNSTNYRDLLFSLNSNQKPLKISLKSNATDMLTDTFCKDEIISISLDTDNKNIVVLSLDINNKVIMLYPNNRTQTFFIEAKVQPPFGKDRLKIFKINSDKTYQKILKFKDREDGVLSSNDIEEIYKLIKESKDFQTAYSEVNTIPVSIDKCNKGDIQ